MVGSMDWIGFNLLISCFLMILRFLRVDTLSLLLSMANIAAHSDVLVVDMVGGLLTGAVAERLGGLLFCFFIRAL